MHRTLTSQAWNKFICLSFSTSESEYNQNIINLKLCREERIRDFIICMLFAVSSSLYFRAVGIAMLHVDVKDFRYLRHAQNLKLINYLLFYEWIHELYLSFLHSLLYCAPAIVTQNFVYYYDATERTLLKFRFYFGNLNLNLQKSFYSALWI